jgi:hypothetical protein
MKNVEMTVDATMLMIKVERAVDFVVPPIVVLKCAQCGYEERSWGC